MRIRSVEHLGSLKTVLGLQVLAVQLQIVTILPLVEAGGVCKHCTWLLGPSAQVLELSAPD